MSKIEKAATSAANTDDGKLAGRLTKEHPYFIRDMKGMSRHG